MKTILDKNSDPHSHANDLYYTHANYCPIPPRANDLFYTILEPTIFNVNMK